MVMNRTGNGGAAAGGSIYGLGFIGAAIYYLAAADPDGDARARHEADLPARVGFVVSKAVGGAVVRNRVRRRLRHLVRDHLSELGPGSELVVRALPAAAEKSTAELGTELGRCLHRVLAARTGAAT